MKMVQSDEQAWKSWVKEEEARRKVRGRLAKLRFSFFLYYLVLFLIAYFPWVLSVIFWTRAGVVIPTVTLWIPLLDTRILIADGATLTELCQAFYILVAFLVWRDDARFYSLARARLSNVRFGSLVRFACLPILLALTWLPNDWGLSSRLILGVWCFSAMGSDIAEDWRQRAGEEVAQQARPTVQAVVGASPQIVHPTCSVCGRESLYEICVECEHTHQREINRVRSQNHRAKKAGEPADLTLAQWLKILDDCHRLCVYCQTAPFEVMEHWIPLGYGHKNGGTTAKNVAPACHRCNLEKSNKHPGQETKKITATLK